MPQLPSPPYSAGSLSIPRTLNRWLDVNYQNGPLTRTATFVILPAFSVASAWLGYSSLIASYNCEAPNNFSLVGGNMEPVAPNYLLAISWQDGKGDVYRYALWNGIGENMLFDLPLYTGQIIKKNFRFEVWSIDVSPAAQTSAINFYTTVAGSLDYRYGLDTPLANPDSQNTSFADTNDSNLAPPISNLLQNQSVEVTGFIPGNQYNYSLGGGNHVLLADDSGGTNARFGSGTLSATLTSYWLITVINNPPNVTITDTSSTKHYLLPLTFPATSISQPN